MPVRVHPRTAACALLVASLLGCGRIGYETELSARDGGAPRDAMSLVDAMGADDAAVPEDAASDASVPPDAFAPDASAPDAFAPDAGACIAVTLTARRTHAPGVSEGASEELAPPRDVMIPSELPVAEGNAGNHWLRVELDDTSGATEVCCYQGGASVSDPTTPEELALGTRYLFRRCLADVAGFCEMPGVGAPSARAPGDVVAAIAARMTVLNGGASAGTTVVEWTLPCP